MSDELELDPSGPPVRRVRPIVAGIAIAGVLGLAATGVALAVTLTDDRADIVATSPAVPGTLALPVTSSADPQADRSAPSRSQVADAIAWAARSADRKLPTTLQYLTAGEAPDASVNKLVVQQGKPSPAPEASLLPGDVVTYTITVSNVSDFLDNATAKDSPLARAMVTAQERSRCRAVASGVSLAPAWEDDQVPRYLWLQCPDGSLERAPLSHSYDVGQLTRVMLGPDGSVVP